MRRRVQSPRPLEYAIPAPSEDNCNISVTHAVARLQYSSSFIMFPKLFNADDRVGKIRIEHTYLPNNDMIMHVFIHFVSDKEICDNTE